MQSPIPIEEPIITQHYTPFIFTCYNQPFEAQITYTEHAVNLKIPRQPNLPKICGGGLFKEYYLREINFHWDSEHTIKGERYPLEGQLIHYAKTYQNYRNALNYKDGIAVLISKVQNEIIEHLLDAIPSKKPLELLEPIIPRFFLPPKIGKFYRYNGSLTTPCWDESVIWTLFQNPSYITQEQLDRLKENWASINKPKTDNCREIQDAEDRRIYQSAV